MTPDLSVLFSGLTYYRQKRVDGGIRAGIMLGSTTVLGHFDEGPGDYDPALVWSVDLRCSGQPLPTTAADARRWLLEHEQVIRAGFHRYADDLGAGTDVTGPLLLEWSEFESPPPGVDMRIVCGAMRRVDARALSSVLEDVGKRWRELVESLTADQPAAV